MTLESQLSEVKERLNASGSGTALETVEALLLRKLALEHVMQLEAAWVRASMFAPGVRSREDIASQGKSLARLSREMRFNEAVAPLLPHIERAQSHLRGTVGMPEVYELAGRIELRGFVRQKELLLEAYAADVETPAEVARARAVVRAAVIDEKMTYRTHDVTNPDVERMKAERDRIVAEFEITEQEVRAEGLQIIGRAKRAA